MKTKKKQFLQMTTEERIDYYRRHSSNLRQCCSYMAGFIFFQEIWHGVSTHSIATIVLGVIGMILILVAQTFFKDGCLEFIRRSAVGYYAATNIIVRKTCELAKKCYDELGVIKLIHATKVTKGFSIVTITMGFLVICSVDEHGLIWPCLLVGFACIGLLYWIMLVDSMLFMATIEDEGIIFDRYN